MGVLGEAFIDILPNTAGFSTALKEELDKAGNEATSSIQKTNDKIAKLGKRVTEGVVAGAAITFATVLKAGNDLEDSQAKLDNALKNAHSRLTATSAQVKELGGSTQKYGDTQAKTNEALTTLIQTTNNVPGSIRNMNVVLDLAAARHMSLDKAALMVGKVMDGNTTILKRFGVMLDNTTGGGVASATKAEEALAKAKNSLTAAQLTLSTATNTYTADLAKHGAASATTIAANAALQKAQLGVASSTMTVKQDQANLKASLDASTIGIAALEAHFKGSAAAAANTFSGKAKALDATVMNFAENLGVKMIPKLEDFLKHLASLGEWLLSHKPVLIAFASAIGVVLAGAMAVYLKRQAEVAVAHAKELAAWVAQTLHIRAAALATEEAEAPQATMNDLLAAMQDILVQLGGTLPEVSAGVDDLAGSTDVMDTSLVGAEAAGAPLIITVGLIAAGVALLVIGILELVKHWSAVWGAMKVAASAFEDFFKKLWHDVEDIFKDALDWLESHWQTVVQVIISLIVPGGIFIAAFWRWHDQIFQIAGDVINSIVTFFTDLPGRVVGVLSDFGTMIETFFHNHFVVPVENLVDNVVTFFTRMPGRIMDAVGGLIGDFANLFSSIGSSISSGFTTGINFVIHILNDFIKLLNDIPFVNIPSIPMLGGGGSSGAPMPGGATTAAGILATGGGYAMGGLVTQPMYRVGEEAPTHPEFVLATNPAYRDRNLSLWAAAGGALGVPGFKSGGVLNTLGNIASDIWGAVTDPRKTAEKIADAAASVLPQPFQGFADDAIASVLGASKKNGSKTANAGTPLLLTGDLGANQKLGQAMAAALGWTGLQWNDLNAVVMRESGWNQYAQNPSSTAYGIAQNLHPNTYPPGGTKAGGSNPSAQISWMLSYIGSRYGTPAGALAHEVAFGWYDQGGFLQPGLTLALNTTGRPEAVGGAGGNAIEVSIQIGPIYGNPDQTIISQIGSAAQTAVAQALQDVLAQTQSNRPRG